MYRNRLQLLGAIACAAAVGCGTAAAAGLPKLQARMTPAQEVPRQVVKTPAAGGAFTATLVQTSKGYRLNWRVTFSRLSGKASSAYIHEGRPGTHGAAFVFLCAPCVSGAHGSAFFSPSELSLARTGQLYVNVRTVRNPAGEVRGQIAVS